ncbi:secreted/surface protein with fasciclin-like repeats [Belliella baltica DSM 15883]|uniref:Secreted/surface protein with fasciclin-like repeats n=1 Tax=Belliella baltica (strain DSM 15883 / CIP 108006 / LMG 21964 / BA134) TaxID=866536 RepID=I3Z5S8_BELBD|nr:fasciclin domain-containing protein [Belliella baltica]AFL84596.1 secreted/surface protein with fasciclin-like repeats [Belliella baltica DSM 15883]
MKDTLKKWLGGLLIVGMVGCGSAETDSASSSSQVSNKSVGQSGVKDDVSNPNVVQVAVGSADHSTLVAALQAADYVDALTNVGPFTVFAPVNTAFDELPAGTLESLVKPENQRKLRDILEYHVLLGVYKKGDFLSGRKMGTADGRSVEINVDEAGEVYVNGGKILGTVEASNGIIHVIDKVLVPN